jgi:hypothetical protein
MAGSSVFFFGCLLLATNFAIFVIDYTPNRHIYSLYGDKSYRGLLLQTLQTTFLELNLFIRLVGISTGIDDVQLYWLIRKCAVLGLTLAVVFQQFVFEKVKRFLMGSTIKKMEDEGQEQWQIERSLALTIQEQLVFPMYFLTFQQHVSEMMRLRGVRVTEASMFSVFPKLFFYDHDA